jgi:hypothetical protein
MQHLEQPHGDIYFAHSLLCDCIIIRICWDIDFLESVPWKDGFLALGMADWRERNSPDISQVYAPLQITSTGTFTFLREPQREMRQQLHKRINHSRGKTKPEEDNI